MIDRIIINNYKCIKQADIKLNSFKNIIVGNNGVGKSTLIEALSLVLGYGLNKFKNEVANEMGVPFKDYNGELSSKQCGSVGGEMVKRMVEQYEKGIK